MCCTVVGYSPVKHLLIILRPMHVIVPLIAIDAVRYRNVSSADYALLNNGSDIVLLCSHELYILPLNMHNSRHVIICESLLGISPGSNGELLL